MNTEEKAKAYDEALERCKEWASGILGHSVDDSPKDIAEFIFPQLAESESEKIIEEIKFAVMQMPSEREDTKQRCLAWLEKQKEPENISASTMVPSCWEVEQKEQKPAEWSEEDEEMYARVVRRYTDYEGIIMRTKDESVATKMLDAMAQEEIWLKSLRPQPKPEWSEEDEEIFNNIIEKAKGGHWIEVNEITWLIARFKSLRHQSHWKPTEEQMKWLKDVLETVPMTCNH